QEESTMTPEQLKTRHVGKQDPKRHLEESVEEVMSNNIVMSLGTMMDSSIISALELDISLIPKIIKNGYSKKEPPKTN
ncbi:15_t:CDS:2, partial [Entrophospora sp. SA101]